MLYIHGMLFAVYNSIPATQPYFEDDFQLDKYETSVAHYFFSFLRRVTTFTFSESDFL